MIIVDTSVWIQAFRVDASPERSQVDSLLAGGEAAIVGIVLAEVLQGSRTDVEFSSLHSRLTALPYLQETAQTWVEASRLSFELRQDGITIPVPDLLIAALALEGDHELYTLDEHFQRIPGLKLYEVGKQ